MKDHVDTWHIHNRINLYLLDAIQEEHLSDALVSKGRTVAEQFAHLHNVRLLWLKASASALMGDLQKLEKGTQSKKILKNHLEKSAIAIASLLEEGFKTG